MRTKHLVLLVVVLLVLLGGVGYFLLDGFRFSGTFVTAEPYHLGVDLALTGTGAPYSKDGVDAIKLAVEEINDRGGMLKKHPIKLFVRDTGTTPDLAVREAVGLILEDNVRCVLGTYSSACAMAIKPVCRKGQVLHIAAISNSENINKADFSPYTFLVVPNSYMQAKAVVLGIARLAAIKGWKEFVTIASDYEWGRSTQESMVALMKAEAPQLKLTKDLWPKLGETEFKPYIGAIKEVKPDFVYGSLASEDNSLWMEQGRKSRLFETVPYPGSLISVWEMINRADSLTRGMVGLCRAPFFAHLDVPMMTRFVENFRKEYNRYPSDWAVLEYDAVYALKQGIDKAGTINSEKVKDALSGMAIDTCRGKLSFRKIDNQLACSSYVGVVADDPKFPFPIYQDLIEIKASDSWRPEKEILRARAESPGSNTF